MSETPPEHTTARRLQIAGLLGVAILTPLLVAPGIIVDYDALLRLAAGRAIDVAGWPPLHDPLSFGAPGALWCNPEWLGDLIWWKLYEFGGFTAVVVLKQLVLVASMLLLATLARRHGASAPLMAVIIVAGLLAASGRLSVRNYVHAFWLVPLYGHLLLSAQGRQRYLWLLLPLGLLWSNLHSSFVLGWVLLGAGTITYWQMGQRSLAKKAALVLLMHIALPLIGPFGLQAYNELIDHAVGSGVYSRLILEWQGLDRSRPMPSELAFHLLATVGLLSFLPRINRQRLGALLLLLAALTLAYRAQRFTPMLLLLAGPIIAANLSGIWKDKTAATVGAWLLTLCLLLWAGLSGISKLRPALESRPGAKQVAQFASEIAPAGSRLFSPFNAGAELLFYAAPPLRLYIDPRNNLGHQRLSRYAEQVLPDPATFQEEATTLRFDLALTHMGRPRFAALSRYLWRSPAWQLLFFDGRHALYAHGQSPHFTTLASHRLEVIRPSLNLGYLKAVNPTALRRDLKRIAGHAPALHQAIEGFLALQQGARDPAAYGLAAATLEAALRGLPPSGSLLSYLVQAWWGAGKTKDAKGLLKQGLLSFPKSAALHKLEQVLSR